MASVKVCTLVLLVANGKILLAMKKRGFGQGHWNGAGGKVEPGETIEQALVRECQEEIGATPLEYQKVAIHDFVFPDDQYWLPLVLAGKKLHTRFAFDANENLLSHHIHEAALQP